MSDADCSFSTEIFLVLSSLFRATSLAASSRSVCWSISANSSARLVAVAGSSPFRTVIGHIGISPSLW